MSDKSSIKLLFYSGSIFLSYFYFGVLQERILRGKYDGDKFIFPQVLLLIQCIVNALLAKLLLSTVLPQGKDTTCSKCYMLCSACYLGAMVSSFTALQYVSYPTQVVGKSCKPIPVMILGVLLSRKHYPLIKYVLVLVIVTGVVTFVYKDSSTSSTTSTSGVGVGEMLLVLSLLLDGSVGVVQEKMKRDHQTKSGHMMFMNNVWSVVYISIALMFSGEVVPFMTFFRRHTSVLVDMLMFSFCSAIGQVFIYRTVTEFGPLPCSLVTTTRKLFTVLFSVVFFGNALTNRQWIGTTMVFSALFLDALYGKKQPVSKNVKVK